MNTKIISGPAIIFFISLHISNCCLTTDTENVFDQPSHLIFKRDVCSANEFQCSDVAGTCVNKDELCDGKWNCKNGDDESYKTCRDTKCPADKFRCATGACIDRKYLCDGVKHCIFGEDDEKRAICQNNTCPATKFRCSTGACLDKHLLCNGFKDCYEGDDESQQTCQNNKCPADKFRCSTGACIDKAFICDGLKHCIHTGDDETPALCQSNTKCPADKFRCSSGACVDRYWICNGFRDCVDGDDETPALCRNNSRCKADTFRCSSGACVNRNWLCNGFKDCHDGDDESPAVCQNNKCSADKFQCKSGQCVRKDFLCNGFKDCHDGDDEKPEVCRNNPKCADDKFRCASGACVNRNWLCNGFRDCHDGDDESPEVCEDNKCPGDKYQCSSGACVNRNWLCNGFRDCHDGDDEIPSVCQAQKVQPTNSTCLLPPVSPEKSFTLQCPNTAEKCSYEPGEKVPFFTQITVTCNAGFQQSTGTISVSSCSKGTWQPPIPKCYKTCPAIKDQDIELSCFQQLRGASIPCDKFMPEGAIVYPKCKDHYHQERDVDYSYIQCLPSGQWDRQLFKCVPDCGKVQGSIQGLISGGKPERRGDSPWHVAIYDISNEPILICGGTIVTSKIIVSAAHCFYNFPEKKLYHTRNFEVVVAKYSRDYKVKDNSETKVYKVRRIFIPDVIEFTGDSTSYAGDIALIWTTEKITFSRGVAPACVDWTDTSRFVPADNAKGKLVGWGQTEDKDESPILLAALLPYISYKNCRQLVSEDFANSIATDKFCAGSVKGAGARPGDSGGGLLFRNTESYGGLYYLRGIVSNKDGTTGEKETSIAAFTDVAQYVTWIYEKRTQIENEELLSETKVPLRS